MVVGILVSRADNASVNIGRALLERRAWEPAGAFEGLPVRESGDLRLVEIAGEHIHAEDVDRRLAEAGFPIDALVVASRHRAASGSPSLTVHPIGNFTGADFGGRPGHLAPAMPAFMARCLRALAARSKGRSHAVTFEATHHGPAVTVPACYVEIGSSEAAWTDAALGNLVADALLDALEGPLLVEEDAPVLVAVGGSHYAPKATDLVRKRRALVGHILPGYQIDAGAGAEGVLAAVGATPGAVGYYLDERGYKPERLEAVLQAFTGLGFGRWEEEDVAAR